jgi:diguanylate cyclase (GGDEF)-like protein
MPASLRAWGWVEVASFPLFYERRFLGRLMLVRTDSERIPWSSVMLNKTQTLVEMLSSAVNHYQLLQNLDYVARHDDLTGIANEGSLAQALERIGKSEFNIAVSCGLLYLDVNHFKEINDILGHESGDQVLQIIAERLPRAVKLRDVAARLHGDEFAVLLTEISGLNQMQVVVQRLEDILSEPTGLAAPADKLSVSIGGIFRLPLGSQAGDLLRAADQVMYQVKRSATKAPMIIDSEMRAPLLEVG